MGFCNNSKDLKIKFKEEEKEDEIDYVKMDIFQSFGKSKRKWY